MNNDTKEKQIWMLAQVVALDHKEKEMNEFTTISLLLLALVAVDASGDAFRFRGWQIASHSMEVVQIIGWCLFAAVFALFHSTDILDASLWEIILLMLPYAVMYIMGRIILFNPLWNVLTGCKLLYVGESNWYDLFIRWVANLKFWRCAYTNVHFIIIFMALLVWVAGILNKSVG